MIEWIFWFSFIVNPSLGFRSPIQKATCANSSLDTRHPKEEGSSEFSPKFRIIFLFCFWNIFDLKKKILDVA